MSRARLLTLAVSALGVVAFVWLSLPLPFLLGPMAACLIAALGGARLGGMGRVQPLMRTILGVTIGTAVTPETVGRLPEMAMSVMLVPIFVLIIGAVGYPFFRKVCGYDHPTAFYSAMPGGLQDMLVFGEEAGGNVRTMSLIHATRVLVIVSLIPILMTTVWQLDLSVPPGTDAEAVPPHELALMVAAALGGWWGGVKVKLFGASIIGPMIATGALSLAGLITHRPPAEAILAAQFFIGLAVGTKYVGITTRELRVDVTAGVGYCLLLALIAFGFAEAVALAGITDPLNAFLAFAPGGQSEMAIIAIIAGADLAFVIMHHLMRVILVITLAPIANRWLGKG
ncbi:AbrB family transcriptional regulator [Halovulum dunhuangense]|uniref:AbrB family transcriptional regulator n=1 Tax=Halovulum dunhuangense TaxID=1505036 RepID=A0A849KZE9_9RHOB|nr:AbrB family transcriptional regulator [Halovulum dunhuangense]NNU79014.1 AbrB family transcriptional regulator [Halovulum dunhuangense]